MGRSIAVISTLQDKWVYVSLAFLIVIIALYILGLRKNKQAVFGLIWFYLPLFILLFFNYLFGKRGNEILLPEHNLYFCYIGLLIFVFSIIGGLKFQDNAKKYLAATFLFFLVFYGGLTISENFIWHDEVRFFERNIKRNQDSVFNFVAYSNLGFAYERKEKFKQAEESFRLAAQRSQGNPYFYNTLATFYIRNKDFDRALKTLMFSLELDKNFYNTYFLLGIVYANKGNAIEARRNFEKALLLNPSDSTSKRYLEALSQK
jgi:tetratricopeptide (TPR) repeat protein